MLNFFFFLCLFLLLGSLYKLLLKYFEVRNASILNDAPSGCWLQQETSGQYFRIFSQSPMRIVVPGRSLPPPLFQDDCLRCFICGCVYSLALFIGSSVCFRCRSFYLLDPSLSLQQNLEGCIVYEFPTIHVVLEASASAYDIVGRCFKRLKEANLSHSRRENLFESMTFKPWKIAMEESTEELICFSIFASHFPNSVTCCCLKCPWSRLCIMATAQCSA